MTFTLSTIFILLFFLFFENYFKTNAQPSTPSISPSGTPNSSTPVTTPTANPTQVPTQTPSSSPTTDSTIIIVAIMIPIAVLLLAAGVVILIFFLKQRKKTHNIERLLNDPTYRQPKLQSSSNEPLSEMKNDNNNKPPESAKSPESSKSPESESNPPSNPSSPITEEKKTNNEDNIDSTPKKVEEIKKSKIKTEVQAKENQTNTNTNDNTDKNKNDDKTTPTPVTSDNNNNKDNNDNNNNVPRRSRSAAAEKNQISPRNLDETDEDSEPIDNAIYTRIPVGDPRLRIPFSELKVGDELGKTYATKVCMGEYNHTPVAIKFLKRPAFVDTFFKDATILLDVPPHPNVVQMIGISTDGPYPIVVYEYCPGGSIMSIYNDATVYTQEYLIKAVRNIAKGMKHLHSNNIIHRNLKAANVLLTENRIPKITDYSLNLLLKNTDERRVNLSGIRWMAPELLASPKQFTFKTDVWAFGITVWELVAKQKPFREIDPLDLGILIRDHGLKPMIPSSCPPILAEIMTECWQRDPNSRPVSL